MKRRIIFLLFILMLLIPSGVALAAPSWQRLVDDEIINNDVVLLDDNLEVAEGATINGDVVIFNGNATIAGTINGDVVLFNGNLTVEETAVLDGDCVLLNGALTDNTADGLACTNVDGAFPAGLTAFLQELPDGREPITWEPSGWQQFWAGLGLTLGRTVLLGLLAFAVASVIPQHLNRVEATMRRKPFASGAIGFLTSLAVPILIVLLIPISIVLILACFIGLLGFPLMFALGMGLVAAGLLGWIAVGSVIGRWLADLLNLSNRSLPVTATFGTVIITFVLGFLGAIPFVYGESVVVLVIMWAGIGAAALTKLGTQPYPLLAASAPAAGNEDKVTAVLETLPDDANTLKE